MAKGLCGGFQLVSDRICIARHNQLGLKLSRVEFVLKTVIYMMWTIPYLFSVVSVEIFNFDCCSECLFL